MRVPQPQLGSLSTHRMEREIGLMGEFELHRALNEPYAYDVGMREKRAINKELGWREHERALAAQAHHESLQAAGFDDGFAIDITDGVPDSLADPLPDPVTDHITDVTAGRFRPTPLDPLPEDVITPETSPLDTVPFAEYESATPASVQRSDPNISIVFEVQFDDGMNSKFNSKFKTK